MENEKDKLTDEQRLEKVSQIFDKSIQRMKDAFDLKERSLVDREKALEEREKLQLLNNPKYVDMLIKKEKINILKGLTTAMTGQSEFFGFAMSPEGIDTERIYSDDEIYHIKDQIQKEIKNL